MDLSRDNVMLISLLVFIGVLMYGPPGTGKTLLARACAAQTNSTYLKLAGPQLVQVCIFRSTLELIVAYEKPRHL